MLKVLLTGGNGMLGRSLRRHLKDEFEFVVADLPECDITDASGFDRFLAAAKPDAVLHLAAMTRVDDCEKLVDAAYAVNALGSANVASACFRQKVRLIAISTDYVFGGDLDRPYNEFDAPAPRNVYGKSKFAGEEAIRRHCPDHVICRISWLYGDSGPSFLHTMVKLAARKPGELKVVNDQTGNPTSTIAVGRLLREILLRREICGTIHGTCEGEATWYDFAVEIFRQLGIEQKVVPCSSTEYVRPAYRPANSRLDKMQLRLLRLPAMPDWKAALSEYLQSDFKIEDALK